MYLQSLYSWKFPLLSLQGKNHLQAQLALPEMLLSFLLAQLTVRRRQSNSSSKILLQFRMQKQLNSDLRDPCRR